jgi:hypothetical protein
MTDAERKALAKLQAEEEKRREREEAKRRAEAEKLAMVVRAEEERARKEAEKAARAYEAERAKRGVPNQVKARTITLRPGQTVAVLEIENQLSGAARSQVNLSSVADTLRKNVARSGTGLLAMDREAIFNILAASEKEVLECSAACEAVLGRILKADYVVSGRLVRDQSVFKLSMLLYRSQDGALLSDSFAVSDSLAGLDRRVGAASTELLSVFPIAY